MRFSGIYIGRVVQTSDPKKLGRVRVRVPHVYGSPDAGEGIPDDALPWAIPAGLPSGSAPSSGGMAWVPGVGDQVATMFLDASPEQPVYLHCMATLGHASANEVIRYEKNGEPVAEKLITAYGHKDVTNSGRRQLSTKGGGGLSVVDKKDASSPDESNNPAASALPPGEKSTAISKVSVFGWQSAGEDKHGNPIVVRDTGDNQQFFDGTRNHPPEFDPNTGQQTADGSIGAAVNPSALHGFLSSKYPNDRIATSYADYASFAKTAEGARYRQIYKQVRVAVVVDDNGTRKVSPPIPLRDMGPSDSYSDRVDLTYGAYQLVAPAVGASRSSNGILQKEKNVSAEFYIGDQKPDTTPEATYTKPDTSTPGIGATPSGTGADGSTEQSTKEEDYSPKVVLHSRSNSFTLSEQQDGTALGQTSKSKCDYSPHWWVVGQRVELVAGTKDNKVDAKDDLKDTHYGHAHDETLAQDSFFGLTSAKRMKMWAKVVLEMVSNQNVGIAAGKVFDAEARQSARLSSPAFTVQGYARKGGTGAAGAAGSTGTRTDSTAGAVGSTASTSESYADTYSMFVTDTRFRFKTSWTVDGHGLAATFDLDSHATKARSQITRDADDAITDTATATWAASSKAMTLGKATSKQGTAVDAETLDVTTTQSVKIGSVTVQVTGDKECTVTVGGASVKVTPEGCLTSVGGVSMNLTSAGVAVTGDVTVTGSVVATVDVTAGVVSLGSHTHGGVKTGTDTTLPPTGSAAAGAASVASSFLGGIFG